MNKNAYTVYDVAAKFFDRPFFEINDETAVRGFKHAMETVPHKDDLVLYKCGSFDIKKGVLIPLDNPEKLITGFDINNTIME